MRIDEPGREDEPGGVLGGPGRFGDGPGLGDGHDPAVPDADVGDVRGRAGAVRHGGALDQVVEHGFRSLLASAVGVRACCVTACAATG
ncbi:hypothetical protein ACFQ10_31110 [Streptomyces indonesiensis]